MADKITLQVARYRPEQDAEPTYQDYEVPCPKEWVVLDGLTYIKDRLDGTLSYRASCLRPRPGPRRAAAQLPDHPRPGRRDRRLHAQAR
jgi:hypothetical protein